MMLGNIVFIAVIGVVIYMMMKGGGGCCGSHDQHGRHKGHDDQGGSGDTNDTGHAHRQLESDLSGKGSNIDPVCGIQVTNTTIECSHLDRTYSFCSEQCKKIFNLNPNKHARA